MMLRPPHEELGPCPPLLDHAMPLGFVVAKRRGQKRSWITRSRDLASASSLSCSTGTAMGTSPGQPAGGWGAWGPEAPSHRSAEWSFISDAQGRPAPVRRTGQPSTAPIPVPKAGRLKKDLLFSASGSRAGLSREETPSRLFSLAAVSRGFRSQLHC